MLDFEISITSCTQNLLSLLLIHDEISIPIIYDFQNFYQYSIEQEYNLIVGGQGFSDNLIDYLNENSLTIYLDDFAAIINHEFFEPPKEGEFQYDAGQINAHDWTANNTDITREFYYDDKKKQQSGNKNSIHEAIQAKLLNENYNILIYDHGTGEVADFITIKEFHDKNQVTLCHIKGSSGIEPGDRVKDVYEVCMQAVKSQAWAINKQTFKNKMTSRTNGNPAKYLTGDLNAFEALMNNGKRLEYRFSIVQPGISQETFSPKLSYILAATDDSIINSGYEPLIVIGS